VACSRLARRAGSSDLSACIFTRPPLWISDIVNHGEHMHQIQSNGIKNTVRETRQQSAPNARQ
jgi:cytochrome c